jgi:hypothetical protein
VMRIASGAFGKGVLQQPAGRRVSRHDTQSDDLEILARLFFVLRRASRRQRVQLHGRSHGVARDAPRVAGTFRGEDLLDTHPEEFEVEGRRRGRRLRAHCGGGDEQTRRGE